MADNNATRPAWVSALAVLFAGAAVLLTHHLGAQSTHMALHIATMNVAAPVAAALCAARLPKRIGRVSVLWASAAAQIGLLWAWHAPAVMEIAGSAHGLHIVAHGVLFSAAFLFWSALTQLPATRQWHSIAALLLTGKLACLLSALLVFSPRELYNVTAHHNTGLDDQQLAGLLMITACPLSYLIAGVMIAARLVSRAEPSSRPLPDASRQEA